MFMEVVEMSQDAQKARAARLRKQIESVTGGRPTGQSETPRQMTDRVAAEQREAEQKAELQRSSADEEIPKMESTDEI